ncbi:MAG: MlaD family protein [Candidatus Endonucleobacter sp. (ex Gigantidas childressi)]|nr:MlaD family protein [Candidatus Endonucleobacter sp. (ex Gigantidas childressi)]
MSKKTVAASVGLFVVLVAVMTIAIVLFISDNNFSHNEAHRYELVFDSSIKGLDVGASVTLRGVKIGEVISIKTMLYDQHVRVLNSVVVDIYPDTVVQQNKDDETELIDELLANGLAAKLVLQSMLTGMLYVEVDFFGGEHITQPVTTTYAQIPTITNNFEEIIKKLEHIDLANMAEQLNKILDNVANLTNDNKLDDLVVNVSSAFVGMEKMSNDISDGVGIISKEFVAISDSIQSLSGQLNKELPATNQQLKDTMAQIQQSIQVMEDTLASDSPFIYQLEKSSRDISRTSRAVRGLAEMLENNPKSILFGKEDIN